MKPGKLLQIVICSTLIGLLVVPAPVVRADEVFTLTAVADASINEALPTTNDGASAILRALSQSAANVRTLVQFDLTALDPAAAIKTSTLRMTLAQAPQNSRTQAVLLLDGSTPPWTEGGVTWDSRDGSNPWTAAGGDFSGVNVATQASGTTSGATLSWNILTDGTIPNIPQNWLGDSAENLGLLIRDATEDAAVRAIVNQVYSGTATSCTAPPTPCDTVVTLPATIDTTRSFLVFQTRSNLARPVVSSIRGAISSSTTVTFTRNTDEASAVEIQWYVVEFLSGVSVQRGTVAQATAILDVPIPTPLAALNRAFVLVSKTPESAGTAYNNDDPVVARLTSTTNLRIQANALNAAHIVQWEIVEFLNAQDAFVQRGLNAGMVAGVSAVTSTLATAVNPSRSFVLISNRHGSTGTDIGTKMITGRLNNCTPLCDQVVMERSDNTDGVTQIAFQVVELRSGATVQSGVQTVFDGNTTSGPIGITAVDTARSFAFLSTQIGGGQNGGATTFIGNDIVGSAAFTAALASNSISLQRSNSQGDATGSWYVAEMNNVSGIEARYASREDPTPSNRPQLDVSLLRNVTTGVITPGISEVTTNWTFPGGSTASNYDGVLFSRRQSGTPTFSPTDGTAYTAGQVFGTSVIAANTPDFNTVSLFDENGPDNVIIPGTSYGYRAFTRDNNTITGAAIAAPPHYSFGANFSTTTLTPGPNDKNWSYRTGAVTLSPPGLTSTTVVAGSNDARFHAMNSTSGGRLYQPTGLVGTTGGAIQARPPVIPAALTTGVDCDSITAGVQPCDISFVGDGVGDVYAFDVATGTRVWSASVAPGGSIQGGAAVQLSIPSNSGFTPTCAPCDVVFVGSRLTADAVNNSVTALNAATGAVVWTFQPGNMDIIVSTPLVDYETNSVWVSSLSNGGTQPSLWRINSSTGVLAESFSFGDISGPPEFSQIRRAVYAVTDAGVLHVIRTDVASCNYSLAAAAGTAVGGPVPSWQSNTDDDIYFVTTNTLNKFHLTLVPFTCGSDTLTDLNGAGWTNPVLSNPSGLVVTPTTPTVPTSQIFIGDDTGRIRRIDPATGAIAGSRDVELLSIIGEPSIDLANNRIYVGTSTGRIYSFNINF